MEYIKNKSVDREEFFRICLNDYLKKGELSKTKINFIVVKYINFFKEECRTYITLYNNYNESLLKEYNEAVNENEILKNSLYSDGLEMVNESIIKTLKPKIEHNKKCADKINDFMIYLISKEKEKLQENLKFIESFEQPIKRRRI